MKEKEKILKKLIEVHKLITEEHLIIEANAISEIYESIEKELKDEDTKSN